MHISSRLLFKTAIVALGLMLVIGLLLASNAAKQANALTTTEWNTVAGYIDSYINSQYSATDDGEAGFLVKGGPWSDASSLRYRLDSDGDGIMLDEGDDALEAPVLVDVYNTGTTWIPGTSYRFPDGYLNAASTTNSGAVAGVVTKHRTAGFSTDIISYCLTGNTELPAVAAYGAMAQAGYFGTPAPEVYAFKWGRLGWGGATSAPSYTNAKNITANLAVASTNTLASNTSCTGTSPDGELVRCAANAKIPGMTSSTGRDPWASTSDASFQPVDLRSTIDASNKTVSNQTTADTAYAIQNPLLDLFDSAGSFANLAKLKTTTPAPVFINRTQHSAGIAATGAVILGYYPTTSWLKFGMPRWNATITTEQFSTGTRGYDYAYTSTAIDASPPTITVGPSTGNITSTSVDISRTTNEPATSKIELVGSDLSTPGGNDTVLQCNKTGTASAGGCGTDKGPTTVASLNPGVTYSGTLTVCDGQANCTSTAISSFTTVSLCIAGAPALTLDSPYEYWASLADFLADDLSVDWTINNTGVNTAYDVRLTSSVPMSPGVTLLTPMDVLYGNIAGGGAATQTVKYDVPCPWPCGFIVNNAGSAKDQCGTTYTYSP